LWGDGINQLFARVSSSGTLAFMLTDHLGSIVGVTNSSGTLIDTVAYDAWGNITSESSPSNGGNFKYAGMVLDATTGIYYGRGRYYVSFTGTWLTQDPLGFGGGDSDLYGYVGNDPTGATDPSGLRLYRYGDGTGSEVWLTNGWGQSSFAGYRDGDTVWRQVGFHADGSADWRNMPYDQVVAAATSDIRTWDMWFMDNDVGMGWSRPPWAGPAPAPIVTPTPAPAQQASFVPPLPTVEDVSNVAEQGLNLVTGGWSRAILTNQTFGAVLDRADQLFAGWASELTMGGTDWLRGQMWGETATRNQQGGWYKAGQWIGFVHSISMMGVNGITNATAQMGKNGTFLLGLRRLVWDGRSSWRQVRGMWSGPGNYLSNNAQNLHHVIFPQRWGQAAGGWIPNGFVNAGLNYAPTTKWVNQVFLNPYAWKGGAAAEWAFRVGFVTQFSPLGNAVRAALG
jgi:RHS repeat-associated protein